MKFASFIYSFFCLTFFSGIDYNFVDSFCTVSAQPDLLLPTQRKPYLEIYCRFGYGFLGSSIYNLIIIIACCYYAFKARKVEENFNESKFIAVSVYSTLIACLAAIPVYITATSVTQKIGAVSVVLLLNTYLTLFCLYIPKLYAIHFASDNIQQAWGRVV